MKAKKDTLIPIIIMIAIVGAIFYFMRINALEEMGAKTREDPRTEEEGLANEEKVSRNDQEDRNIERMKDLKKIAEGVLEHASENEGRYPPCITEGGVSVPLQEEVTGNSVKECNELREFLGEVPQDPLEGESYKTGWSAEDPNKIVIWSTAKEALEEGVWIIQ